MSRVRDTKEQFEAAGAAVAAINIDHRFVQKAFSDQLNLNYPLISDPNREWLQAVGHLLPDVAGVKGVAPRGLMIIDRDLTVRHAVGHDAGTQPDYDTALAAVQAI